MNALKKAKLIQKIKGKTLIDLIISETMSPRVFCHATEQSDITYLEPYGKCVTLLKNYRVVSFALSNTISVNTGPKG